MPYSLLVPSRILLACTAALATSAAFAAGAKTTAQSEAQAAYQQERAACMSGQSGQERADCLKEASAALAESRRGELSSAPRSSANAKLRCDALSGADKSDCLARMEGGGTTSGSVKGGGILRQKVTVVPAGGEAGAARSTDQSRPGGSTGPSGNPNPAAGGGPSNSSGRHRPVELVRRHRLESGRQRLGSEVARGQRLP
jgi:hypothetical protein